ncbi:MAG TPA: Asp-tRNA(Asn)/Glu-tRNA(Gln) amidotransferase subunit GatC [Oscillatoriaceae cyanobacterium]
MIQQDDVRHIAKLARLELDSQELERYTEQLGRILDYFGELAQLDTAGVPLTAHPLPVSNALREDSPRPSLPLEGVFVDAPSREGDYFRVPKILEG